MSALLALESAWAGYGESIVIEDVSVGVEAGECVAVLGRNGVGKTTLLSTFLGATRLHRGTVRWEGRDITREPMHRRAQMGLGWVPQERGMWRSLSVDEHLAAVERPGRWNARRTFDLFPRLAERRRHHGAQLSGGEQQMLAIARALVANPRVLLLDEPLEGLAPIVIRDLMNVLRGLATDGDMSLLLVEQHARLALSIASRALVMDRGRIVHMEDAKRLSANPVTLERWLAVPR
jgi:branched-chain amino acid transport system ATP-binding protein